MKKLLWIFLTAIWFSSGPVQAQTDFNGNITAASTDCSVGAACVEVILRPNDGALSVTVAGTYSGTLQFEVSTPPNSAGVRTWVGIGGDPMPSGSRASSTTSTGTWSVNVAGFDRFRVRGSAYSSGTATIAGRGAPASAKSRGIEYFTVDPTFSTMTSGSVLFAGTGGLLSQDNTNLAWDDSANALTLGGLTAGQVVFPNASKTLAGSSKFTWDDDASALAVTGTDGLLTNVIGVGQTYRSLGVKQIVPVTPTTDNFSFAGVFEAYTGTYTGGSLTDSDFGALLIATDRNSDDSTRSAFGANILLRDSSATGLTGKGPLRGLEIDFVNSSGADATDGGRSYAAPAATADWEQNGLFITSPGTNKGGIGAVIKSNNAGDGNWKRGLVITDYDTHAVDLIKNTGNGQNMLAFDSIEASQTESILFSDAGVAKWVLGKGTTNIFSVYDVVATKNRISFNSGVDQNTFLDATGYGNIALNYNSGTGGTNFGNGASATVASINSSGIFSVYKSINTVSSGVPAEYATVDLAAQTAAVGTTTLYAVPATGAGQYRVNWNAKVTTPATTGAVTSTLGALTIVYTDPDGVAQTVTAPASLAAGSIATSSAGNTTATVLLGLPLMLNCKASTNITYAMAYASDTASQMAYNLHIKLEAL